MQKKNTSLPELNLASEVLQAALESSANAIVFTDKDATILWANPAFSRMTGYALDEVRGRHARILKSGAHRDEFYAELWRTILSGQAWHGEMTNRRKDGSLYTEESTITPISHGTGCISYFIAIKRDVTE